MELEELKERWQIKTGETMPDNIASQSLDLVRKAVKYCEAGFTVGIAHIFEPATEEVEESMMDWDRQDQKNGNAYGGS